MKSIKIILLSVAICFASVVLILQSCTSSIEELTNSQIIKSPEMAVSQQMKVKKIVESNEFLELSNKVQEFNKKVNINYYKLSKNDKDKFHNLITELMEVNDTTEIINGLKQCSSIVNVDIVKAYYIFKADAVNIAKMSDCEKVDKKDLITAIQLKRVNNNYSKIGTNVRFKTQKEYYYDNACLIGCQSSYVATMIGCAFIPPPLDVVCILAATLADLACTEGCKRYYN